MIGLLDLPEAVMLHHLFPKLGHNDLLRLRRVCQTTNEFATKYICTPKKGHHQGKWILKIQPSSDDKNLESFLQMNLPQLSRLQINLNSSWSIPSPSVNFFEDPNLPEFIRIYSEFVTHLEITRIQIPFTNAKEVEFYESLVNLEELKCEEIRTDGVVNFSYLPSTFQKLKSFEVWNVDFAGPLRTFVFGMGSLERFAGFKSRHPEWASNLVLFSQNLIEESGGGGERMSKLKLIDWKFGGSDHFWDPRGVLDLFALCSEKGIKVKGISAYFMDAILCDPNNGQVDTVEILDEQTGEQVYRVDYQRNGFVANVIQSMVGLRETVFLMELPYLEELLIRRTSECGFRFWRRHGIPKWPNLRKLDVTVDGGGLVAYLLDFLCGWVKRPKLEEMALRYYPSYWRWRPVTLPLPNTLNMENSLGNLRKLTVEDCNGDSAFFLAMWDGLRLLESVELLRCHYLGDEGFIGYSGRGNGALPVFMKLKKLRHLSIRGLHEMPWLTDKVFWKVFRHMKLASLKLSGLWDDPKVTEEGIKALLTGEFAESIEKLDFEELYLFGISEDGRKELNSRFRSSKML